MIAHYGFSDGSGNWYVTIDTDKCNGCGECVSACPSGLLQVGRDEMDLFQEKPVAFVREEERKRIRYHCAPCKPGYGDKPTPCVMACVAEAIQLSEGWRLLYGQSISGQGLL